MRGWQIGIGILALCCAADAALAGSACVQRREVAALKVAALQQKLVVAALSCHAVPRYNAFVISYRRDLQKSDNALKAFFIRRGGISEYHAFKTKLANNSSLTSIGDMTTYCQDAFAAFDVALAADHRSLREFALTQNASLDIAYLDCQDEVVVASRAEKRALRKARRMLARASAAGEP
ncbi:MAG: hypothetical protein JO056_12520 [Alphaproteobacteria bacterium]|nr:hypothetical protein [Alphaproteobacteria bacterium]